LITALGLKVVEKIQDHITGQMIDRQRFYFHAMVVGGKGQKQFKGIPVGLYSLRAATLDAGQVLHKVLMDATV
jgi:hypothetical protein